MRDRPGTVQLVNLMTAGWAFYGNSMGTIAADWPHAHIADVP